jgi:hypothetical protein
MKAREFIPWLLATGAIAYLVFIDGQYSGGDLPTDNPGQTSGPSSSVGGGGGDAF